MLLAYAYAVCQYAFSHAVLKEVIFFIEILWPNCTVRLFVVERCSAFLSSSTRNYLFHLLPYSPKMGNAPARWDEPVA